MGDSSGATRRRLRGRGCAAAVVALLIAAAVPGQGQRPANALYLTAGLGVLNLEDGTGLGVPIGLTLLSTRLRLLATVTPLDCGLMEDRDPRYLLRVDPYYGVSYCLDLEEGRQVPHYRCTPSTELSRSGSAELGFIPIETVYFAGKVGRLHTGLGMRYESPRSVYGTVGLFFDSASGGSAAGVRVSMGRRFTFLGVSWGLNARRLLRGL